MLENFTLNEQQQKAATHVDGAVLVLAGAGSGKTRVLTARVAYLLSLGVSPRRILAITFTNKAAGEMKERIRRLTAEECPVWTSTFHSFCTRVLRYDGDVLGYTDAFSIFDEADSDRVIKRLFERFAITEKSAQNDVMWQLKSAKNAGQNPDQYYAEALKHHEKRADTVYEVYRAYKAVLRAMNALDFDDLLSETARLFDEYPSVLERWQRRFDYIMVDEFQDTNRIQYKIVKQLADVHKNLFVVGDEDQSIYSWRGADIHNIMDFQTDFPQAEIVKLEENYRSTQNILDAANSVIKFNRSRYGKSLWSKRSSDDKVEAFGAGTGREEVDFVVKNIIRLMREGYRYSDFAVLMRTNAQSLDFETAFNVNSFPYKVFGGFKFFERREIKDVVAYLRATINPRDNESVLRVVNFPKRGIGEASVTELVYRAEQSEVSVSEYLSRLDELPFGDVIRNKLSAFAMLLTELRDEVGKRKPSDFVRFLIERAGIKQYYAAAKEDERDRYENIEEFLNSVYEYEKDNPAGTIDDFLQSVALLSDADEITDGNYVTVATVHAVKGMEFPVVFVTGLEENLFPTSRAIAEGDVEEERRLMYVAMTRAKNLLFLSHAQSRYRFGKYEYNLRSRFLTEAGCPEAAKRQVRMDSPSATRGGYGGYSSGGYSQRSVQPQYKPSANRAAPRPQDKPASAARQPQQAGADYSAYKQGASVTHDRFGKGVILKVDGEGVNTCLEIAFQGLGVKRFYLAMAISHLKAGE